MAEMTKDMYGAVGRLGNKTYHQCLGKTIARTIIEEIKTNIGFRNLNI